jgi:Putative Actinobacterial Holin-X, holin superfamily III
MSVPKVDQVAERPLQELAQTASQQAVVLAREQVDAARRELTARASQAAPGVAMVGGGALLAALASGTGTAALILLLARRPGASAAALGVTGAYAGAGAFLAREGLVRLREAGPPLLDVPVKDEPVQNAAPVPDEPVQNAKQDLGSAKQRTKSPAKSPPLPDVPDQDKPRQKATQALGSAKRGTKSAAKSPPQPTGRPKPKSKSPSSRRRASRT